jgi:Ca-activated chloride channel family protein
MAYRSNDFALAASAFEQAMASPDRAVQQRALYNLGNAVYRLGQAQAPQAQALWQRAVKRYEAALALEPNDADAKYNLEFVKKKLEELQQQQRKQQEKDQNQRQKTERQNGNQQQTQQNQEQEQQHQRSDKREGPEPRPKQQPQDQQEPQAQEAQAGNLDKQLAKALLDNVREDERNWNFFPELQMKEIQDAGPPAKDW